MTGSSSVRLADSDRARVPFAVVGVLVLVASSVTVVSIQRREEPRTDVDVAAAVERLEARANAAVRAAATEGLVDAAAAPVTDPANTSVGVAIEPGGYDPDDRGYADATFRNYAELRIYLAARQRFADASQRLSSGVVGRLSLPPVRNDTASVAAALDRVHLRAGTYDDARPTGVVLVRLSNVTVTVRREGEVLAEHTRTVNVTVPTTVFEMHEKTQEYERRLETGFFEPGFDTDRLYYGFGRKFAVRQYPVSWAKAYLDRYAPPSWDRAFPNVHEHTHTEILANDAIYSVQKATFGTVDPHAGRIMRERWLCFGLTAAYDVFRARGATPNATATDRIVNGTMVSWLHELNRSLRQTLADRFRMIRVAQQQRGAKKALCQATQFLFGRTGGDLPAAPRITDVVTGVITTWLPGSAPSNNAKLTVAVDRFADAAYYRATGQNVTQQLRDDLRDPANQTGIDPPDDSSRHNFSAPNGTVGAVGFEDRIDEVIAEVYDVRVTVGASTSGAAPPTAPPLGGNWNQTGSTLTVATAGTPTVTSVAGPDGTPSTTTTTDLQTVSVLLENRVVHRRTWERPCTSSEHNATSISCPRTTTTSTSANRTFQVDVDVDATHSQGTRVEVRGMAHAYDAGGPGPAPNYQSVRPAAIDAVFDYGGGAGGLEAALAARIDPPNVTTAGDLATQLDYDTSVNVNASLNASHRAALASWLRGELNETRTALERRVRPLELDRTAVLTDDGALEPLIDRVGNHSDALVYANVTNGYDNPAEKARAELRTHYLDDVVQRIEASEQGATDRMDELESKLGGLFGGALSAIDDGVGNALAFARSVLAGNVSAEPGHMVGSPLYDDVEFVVDGSPSYLSVETVSRGEVPAVRARDGGITDLNASVTHAPMVTKFDNLVVPYPGLPVLPPLTPGLVSAWFVTLSTWKLEVRGEYARFELRARIDDPVRSGTTSYVRDARPVEVSLAGGPVTAGRVEAVDFESYTFVIVVVPSYFKQPRGKPGVGDMWENSPTQVYSCGGPFPHVGPQPGPTDCYPVIGG